MELGSLLRTLARRWRIIGAFVVLGTLGGIGVTEFAAPQFHAASQLFVSARDTSSVEQLNQGNAFSQARVQSYANIISSPVITQPVIDRYALPLTPRQLARRITAVAELGTVLIDITVVDTDPRRAAQIANGVAQEASRQIVSLETPAGQTVAPVNIGITRVAVEPAKPVFPRSSVDFTCGLLVGLLTGIGSALLRDGLDTSLRSQEALAEATGLVVLGSVPFDSAAPDNPLAIGPVFGGRAEAFRRIRTNLQFAQVDRPPKVIAVTSPSAREGKTGTAANLALRMAEAGGPVCLVDADLRSPSVAGVFGLVQNAGLTSVLIGDSAVEDVLQCSPHEHLRIMTSGPIPPNPAELLASGRMSQVLQELSECFGTVILDTAPVLPVADTLGLSPLADGVIVVVRARATSRDRVVSAANSLRATGSPLLGGVLSMVRLKSRGYGYGYGYGETAPTHLWLAQSGGPGEETTVPQGAGA